MSRPEPDPDNPLERNVAITRAWSRRSEVAYHVAVARAIDAGVPVARVARIAAVTRRTAYRWHARYGNRG